MKFLGLILISTLLLSCDRNEIFYEDEDLYVDDSYFEYSFEKVYDYYIINAWRDLDEPVPAYTTEMLEKHTKLVGELPWVMSTPSSNLQMVIGQTPGWGENPEWPEDPEIPPQNIYGYQITDPRIQEPKLKIILVAGNHSTEYTGNYVLEGMVNFLAGCDPRAIFLRKKTIFFVYPDINPEGKYMAVNRINLNAAPDPNAGTDGRKRGNPELYAAGEKDHNRIWKEKFFGKFSTLDLLRLTWEIDTENKADYLWDMHGPQMPANWRSPRYNARVNKYAEALMKLEPEVLRCGPPGDFKVNVASGPPGKLTLYAESKEALHVKYPYTYEPGGWTRKRLMESGKRLAIAFYDKFNK